MMGYLMFLMMRLQCCVLTSARASSRDFVTCNRLAGSVCNNTDLDSSESNRKKKINNTYINVPNCSTVLYKYF